MTPALSGNGGEEGKERREVVKKRVVVVCGVLAVVVVVVNVEGGRGDLTDSYLTVFGGCGRQGLA